MGRAQPTAQPAPACHAPATLSQPSLRQALALARPHCAHVGSRTCARRHARATRTRTHEGRGMCASMGPACRCGRRHRPNERAVWELGLARVGTVLAALCALPLRGCSVAWRRLAEGWGGYVSVVWCLWEGRVCGGPGGSKPGGGELWGLFSDRAGVVGAGWVPVRPTVVLCGRGRCFSRAAWEEAPGLEVEGARPFSGDSLVG
jgi:hypothetical protein